jgi:ferric-dicitrate binding protein FerR (iron transport regulator)
VAPEPTADTAESPSPAPRDNKRRRRLIRWAAIGGALILAVLACWQDPVYAL